MMLTALYITIAMVTVAKMIGNPSVLSQKSNFIIIQTQRFFQ